MQRKLRKLRLVKCMVQFLLLTFLVLSNQLSHSSVSAGLSWLENQQSPDGSYSGSDDITTPFQNTAEVLRTLNIIPETQNLNNNAALQFIDNEPHNNTQQLARKIVNNTDVGNNTTALISFLKTHQNTQTHNPGPNADNGFGGLMHYDSTTLDTAFALEALAISGASIDSDVTLAVDYLQGQQQNDGSWRLNDSNSDAVYITAIAMRALWHYRNTHDLSSTLNSARTHLLNQRNAFDLWDSTFESALALIAIIPTLIDRNSIQNSLQALQNSQQANGSFDNNVYQTALALRALRLAELPSPDEITLSGKVIDGDTGLPLTKVNAALTGPISQSTTSNNEGIFNFTNLAAGDYQLELSLSGYSALITSTSFQIGQQQNLGNLRLLKTVANPTTGTIIGTVTDNESGVPIHGAGITVSGITGTTSTDKTGQYQISNLSPGAITIQISANGFNSAHGSATINAGQVLAFSPALIPLTNTQVILSGSITDQDTGQPLENVTVNVQGAGNNQTTNTDNTGQFRISGLLAGELIITASLNGYQSVVGNVTATQGTQLNFSPQLALDGNSTNPSNNSVINGVIVDQSTDLPLANVQIELNLDSNTQTRNSQTDGSFAIADLGAGSAQLTFDLNNYQSKTLNLNVSSNTVLDMGDIALAPDGFEEESSIQGVVVDSSTNQPLANVTIGVQLASGNQTITTNNDGIFTLQGIIAPEANLTFSFAGYNAVNFLIPLEQGQALNIGQIRLRKETVIQLLPDLTISSINTNSVTTDLNTLAVGGELRATLSNQGDADTQIPFNVIAFYDSNNDNLYDQGVDAVLGQTQISNSINVDNEFNINIPLSGTTPFRDAPIHILVDSKQLIAELDELNNIDSTANQCEINGRCDLGTADSSEFEPVVKWHWNVRGIRGAPLVAQTTDDNNDGVIDVNDTPDVIFVDQRSGLTVGHLIILDGETGQVIYDKAQFILGPESTPAVGDIDNDGIIEIIGVTAGGEVIALNHDGSFIWQTSFIEMGNGTPSIADIDQDGSPDIIYGKTVLNADGSTKWQGAGDFIGAESGGYPKTYAMDIDPSPGLEVIIGASLYDSTGNLLWQNDTIGDGFTAVGDFDADTDPEIVIVNRNNSTVTLLDHTGNPVWGPSALPGDGGGSPTVADINGDGVPEIGVPGSSYYTVFNADGSILWQTETNDNSGVTGSTVFDLDGDGKAEVFFNDQDFFYALKGDDGEVLFQVQNRHTTAYEYPTIADIDNDGHAEILVTSIGGDTTGLRAFEDINDAWVDTRNLWNQYSYHIGNINDDGSIPTVQANSWQTHNTFRLNTFPECRIDGAVDPVSGDVDLTISQLQLTDNGIGQTFNLRARVGNSGNASSLDGVTVKFYNGDPSTSTLLGNVTIPTIAKGRFIDVQLDNISNISNGDTLYVIVDSENLLNECREDNNQMMMIAGGILGQIKLSTDQAGYLPNTDLQLNSLVTNLGNFNNVYQIETTIKDSVGNIVVTLPPEQTGLINSGDNTTLNQVWNTGLTLAGNYIATATLKDLNNQVIDQISAAFAILETLNGQAIANLRTTTDKQTYHTTDQVQIQDLVRNISQSTLLNATVLDLEVTSPSNTRVLDTTVPVGDLAAGGLRDLLNTLELQQAEQGVYTVNAKLIDNNGSMLAADQAQFTVNDNINLSLTGSLTAQLPLIQNSETQICTYTVSNNGTVDLTNQELWQVLVNITDGTEVLADRVIQTINSGQQHTFIQSLDTKNLNSGDYACVLQTTINNERQSLAQSAFMVEQIQNQLDAVIEVTEQGRVLVLIDSEQDTCTATQSVTFTGNFDNPIGDYTKVYAKAYDQWGRWLDEESSRPEHFDDVVDYDNGYRPIDITITALDNNAITVKIDAKDKEHRHRHNAAFRKPFVVKIFYNHQRYGYHSSAQQLSSGLLDMPCGQVLDVPSQQNDLMLIESGTIERLVRDHQYNHGERQAETPNRGDQRDYLETILNNTGINYTITDDPLSFIRAFNSGLYNQYLLLADHTKFKRDIARQLREAVNRGDGLIFAGGGSVKHESISQPLGIIPVGPNHGWPKHYQNSHQYSANGNGFLHAGGLELLDTELHRAITTTLLRDDRYFPVELDAATLAGQFNRIDITHCHHNYSNGHYQWQKHRNCAIKHDTAVTFNQYGLGKSVYIGFDLLAEALLAKQGNSDDTFESLLLNSIAYTQPTTVNTRAGAPVPIALTLENVGITVNGLATITLPPGSQIVDADGGTVVTDNQVQLTYQLETGQVSHFLLWVVPHYQNGAAVVEALVQSINGQNTIDLETLVLTINEQLPVDIHAVENTLAAIEHEDRRLRFALHWLRKAIYAADTGDTIIAKTRLLKTADVLERSNHPAAADIRLAIDWLIWQLAKTH